MNLPRHDPYDDWAIRLCRPFLRLFAMFCALIGRLA